MCSLYNDNPIYLAMRLSELTGNDLDSIRGMSLPDMIQYEKALKMSKINLNEVTHEEKSPTSNKVDLGEITSPVLPGKQNEDKSDENKVDEKKTPANRQSMNEVL